jgi:hypothetical protein
VVVSYHALIHTKDGDVLDILGTIPGIISAEQEYLRTELHQVVRDTYAEQRAKVKNEKHGRILDTWQASHFEMNTIEIASSVGVSQSYVSQVLNNFKYSMRKRLEVYVG